jgi:hypothetical protein
MRALAPEAKVLLYAEAFAKHALDIPSNPRLVFPSGARNLYVAINDGGD